MSIANPYGKYQETQIMTASQPKLLIMAFDAAIRFSRTASDRMKEGRLDEQGTYITRVQNILLELIGALNPKADRQLAANLDALYSYMFDRLTHANIHDDLAAMDEVIGILTEMRATWAEAERLSRGGAQPSSSFERKAA